MLSKNRTKADKHKLSTEITGYDEVSHTPFDVEYVVDHIKIPSNSDEIPQIVGWSGPARSGTSGLLFLLAGHPRIEKAFFQPLKTILRSGGPDLVIEGNTICLKEVFRSCCAINDHDPISMLLAAGVPASKISWAIMLRDPVQGYNSWDYCINGHTPDHFAMAQKYALSLYERYKNSGINIVPFAYDLLALGEQAVLDALLSKLRLGSSSLKFDLEAINSKLVYPEKQAGKGYFDLYLKPTLQRHEFVYSPREITLPKDITDRIEFICRKDYEQFYKLSKNTLGL